MKRNILFTDNRACHPAPAPLSVVARTAAFHVRRAEAQPIPPCSVNKPHCRRKARPSRPFSAHPSGAVARPGATLFLCDSF